MIPLIADNVLTVKMRQTHLIDSLQMLNHLLRLLAKPLHTYTCPKFSKLSLRHDHKHILYGLLNLFHLIKFGLLSKHFLKAHESGLKRSVDIVQGSLSLAFCSTVVG